MIKLTLVLADETVDDLMPALLGTLKPSEMVNMHLEKLPEADPAKPAAVRGSHPRRSPVAAHPPQHNGQGLWFRIAGHFSIGHAFTLEQARDYAKSIDYSPSSASGVISDLIDDGFARRNSEGSYTLLKLLPPTHRFNRGSHDGGLKVVSP